MSPDDYGVVALIISYMSVLSIVLHLNLSGSLKQIYLRSKIIGDKSFNVISSISLLLTIIISITVYLGLVLWGIDLVQNYNAILIFLGALTVPKLLLNNKLIGEVRSKFYSSVQLLQILFEFLASLILLIVLSNDVLSRLLPLIVSHIIISLLFSNEFRNTLKINGYRYYKKIVKYSFSFSIPLIGHQLGHIILSQLDRIQINSYYGSKQVGLYSFAYSVALIFQILAIAYNNGVINKVYENLKNEKFNNIAKLNNYVELGLFSLIMIIYLYSDLVYSIITPDEYQSSIGVFEMIIWLPLIFLIYFNYVNVSFFYSKTRLIAIGTTLAGTLNYFLNVLLLPKNGYEIAALTTIICYSILALYQLVTSYHLISFSISKLNHIASSFLLLIIIFICLVG